MNRSNDGNGYEPNFIMKDPPPEPEEEQKKEEATFSDPRDNFRKEEAVHEDEPYAKPHPSSDFNDEDYAAYYGGYAGKDSSKKKGSAPVTLTRKSLALIIALCVVLSTVFGFTGSYIKDMIFGGSPAGSGAGPQAEYELSDPTGDNMPVQEITAKAKNSVVEIKTESVSSDAWMQQYVTEGAGSGVIITDDGYIMTNNHVIDGAAKITVTTADKKSYSAKLIGTDPMNDVAVIKVDAEDLSSVTYGNSDKLNVGDLAVAIGNPLGELGGTVTAGIISAKDRQLAIDGKTMTLLQTDTSINPGNSGGGLFNGSGQLVGLVVAKSSGSDVEGLGFAIPINKAADIAQQLMDKGYVSDQPFTGMSYTEASAESSSLLSQGKAYVVIHDVNGKNARKAGFEQGDIVLAIDGEELGSLDQLSSIITAHKVGDKLTYTVMRDDREMEITFALEEKNNK